MNLGELQAELRHFAAERDWQPFHTPKNLATALMVEAAELAEIFQWMTPEESVAARDDADSKLRIGFEVVDVLLYLLQVADHCQIDLAHAVRDKLAKNAIKYPAKRVIARVSPARASVPGTHVLIDYENVQPTDEELRALAPDARYVWVFHGPHQRDVQQRFASFGDDVTAVPISRAGKNALDFHLSFYMGYIASSKPAPRMVVVSNDKGYEPMLEHAKAMGFEVLRLSHGKTNAVAKKTATKQTPVKRTAAKKAATAAAAKKKPAKKAAPTKKVAAKKTPAPPAAKKSPATKKTATAKTTAPPKPSASKSATASPDSAATIKKLTDSLRKMADKRPTKPKSLWRSLKSFLGIGATEEAIEAALGKLIADGVVKVDSTKGVSYPGLGS